MSEESPTLAPTPIMDAAWRKFRPEKNSYSTDKLRKAGAAIERELAAVTAERDALRKDAERYRWLRNISHQWSAGPHIRVWSAGDYEPAYEAEADAAVDGAIDALSRP